MTQEQREYLRGWLERQESFGECLTPEQTGSARSVKREQLEETELLMVGEPERFVVWQTGLTLEGTGEPLSRVWGWQAPQSELPRLFSESSSRLKPGLLAIDRRVDGEPSPKVLQGCGFELQRHRLVLFPRAHNLQEERYRDFTLRAAGDLDRPLLINLASETLAFTLPPGEDDRIDLYSESLLSKYQVLDYGSDSPYDLLLAEHRPTRSAVGYILLFEDENGYICLDDLAVKREQWGKYVGHFMVRSVENLLVEHGYPVMYAEISQANRRSFLTAQRQLHFRPDLQYWLKRS